MVFARNELAGPRQSPLLSLMLLWLLGSAALGLLGPYGTWVLLPLVSRLAFWAGILIAALTVAGGAAFLARVILPQRPYLGLLVEGGLTALILGPMIWSLCCVLPHADPALVPPPGKIMLAVFALWLCVVLLRGLPRSAPMPVATPVNRSDVVTIPRNGPTIALQRAAAATIRPAFLERSDLHLPGAVMRVSADDHYLVIQTTHGTGRIIMRFRDALPDLADLPYGVCKAWHHLKREGFTLARCTVERLMKQLGIRGAVRGKVVKTTVPDTSAPCPRDKVNRVFRAPAPKIGRAHV